MKMFHQGLTPGACIPHPGTARFISAATALLTAWIGSAALASIVTTQSFTYPSDVVLLDSNETGTGLSTYEVTDGSTDPVMTVQPFTGNPSDLVSFTIWFDLTYDITHVNGPDGGSFSTSAGGNFLLDSILADGDGNGTGNGGGPNSPLNASFPISYSQTYLPSEANILYDPALLNLVVGATPFELRYDHNPQITISGTTDSFLMSIRGNSSFGMTYTAIPEPATALLLLGGALFLYVKRKA
jgi:hypothetical protein